MGDLFDVDNWVYGKNKEYKSNLKNPTPNSISVISGITENNGTNYYTEDKLSKEEVFERELTISTRGEYSGTVFYHQERFALANNILVMIMQNLNKNQKQFIGSVINALPYGGYSGYPKKETLKNDIIQLPIKNNTPDFDFMDAFIAELQQANKQKLKSYLAKNGLLDCTLTDKERLALEAYNNSQFKEFNLVDIFDVKNTKNILSRDIIENSGNTPYLCASSDNNGVSSYIEYNQQYLDMGNCIFIGGKTFVVSYQEKDFYSNDSHNLCLYLKQEHKKTRLNQLFLVTCINKSLKNKYSWGYSISNKKIQEDKILLPVKNNQIDFDFMDTLISAVHKLMVKNVVRYVEK